MTENKSDVCLVDIDCLKANYRISSDPELLIAIVNDPDFEPPILIYRDSCFQLFNSDMLDDCTDSDIRNMARNNPKTFMFIIPRCVDPKSYHGINYKDLD